METFYAEMAAQPILWVVFTLILWVSSLIVLFALPIFALVLQKGHQYIYEYEKIGRNPIHVLYFTKLLKCDIGCGSRIYSDYINGTKWLSSIGDYESGEYYGHALINSIIFSVIVIIGLYAQWTVVLISSIYGGMWLARQSVRVTKKLKIITKNLSTHINDKNAHKGDK